MQHAERYGRMVISLPAFARPNTGEAAVPARLPAPPAIGLGDREDNNRREFDTPACVPRHPPTGSILGHLAQSGAVVANARIAPGGVVQRATLFHADPVAGLNTAPHARHFGDPDFSSYAADDLRAYLATDVTVLGEDGVVLVRGRIVPETLSHLMPWRSSSQIEAYSHEAGLELRRELPVVRSPVYSETLMGFSASWSNYAHWMQECMPKLLAFRLLASTRPGLRLLLPRLEPGSFQADSLALLGIPAASVVTVEPGQAVSFSRCWLISTSDIWSIHPVLRDIAAVLRANAGRSPGTCRRVYIHRSTPIRRVANFESLLPVLQGHGFSVVSFEHMPVAEQIAHMSGADIVIGEHGAGMANIQFCNPGTRVLELFNETCVQPAFWSLASCFNLAFGMLIGRSITSDDALGKDWNSAYEIAPDRLDAAIRLMIV